MAVVMAFSMPACSSEESGTIPSEPPKQTETDKTRTTPDTEPDTTPEVKPDTALQTTPDTAPDTAVDVEFDAESAVTVEVMTDGVKYIFNTMPQTAADIEALISVYPVTDRHNTVAFFMTSLVKYIEDTDEGLAMIDVLKGPQKLSDTDKSFIKDRFSDKKYLPRVYFEGATPGNNYTPDQPWTIVIYDDPVAPPEGYTYVNLKASAFDNPRRICLRLKGEENWLWEYNAAFLSVKQPAEEDPWR